MNKIAADRFRVYYAEALEKQGNATASRYERSLEKQKGMSRGKRLLRMAAFGAGLGLIGVGGLGLRKVLKGSKPLQNAKLLKAGPKVSRRVTGPVIQTQKKAPFVYKPPV